MWGRSTAGLMSGVWGRLLHSGKTRAAHPLWKRSAMLSGGCRILLSFSLSPPDSLRRLQVDASYWREDWAMLTLIVSGAERRPCAEGASEDEGGAEEA
eukprot:3443024-Rhodomonas_salina.3